MNKEFERKRTTAVCCECGTTYRQYVSTQRFCSESCRNKHHYRERAEIFKKYRPQVQPPPPPNKERSK